MWAALTALFVVLLIVIAGAVVYLGANLVSFLQPILIPVAIAAILAYLLDPLVTRMSRHGLSRTKSVLLLFAIAGFGITALGTWLLPVIWYQSASLAKELPQYTVKARDQVADLIYRYDRNFGSGAKSKDGTSGVISWLLGSPTPARATPTPATAEEFTPVSPTPRIEEIAPAPA